MAVDRLAILIDTLEVLRESLQDAPPDKRASIAGQIRALLVDIDALGGAVTVAVEVERTGLVDFQQRLAERESASKAARKAAR